MRKTARFLISITFFIAAGLSWSVGFAQEARLDKGEIIVATEAVKGSDIPRIIVKGVVEAPPEKVWKIIEDCQNYDKTMPRIESSKRVSVKGQEVTCRVEIDLPFPLSNLTATTLGIHTEQTDRFSRKWSLVEGDYKFNSGSWVLTWFKGNPNRTMVVYTVHAEPKNVVPDWVREKAQKSSMPGVIERLREEVARL